MNPAHVFHVSERDDIQVFYPRPPPSMDAGVSEDVVWAIDYAHLANYLTPRDCPRVTFGRGPGTGEADAEAYLKDSIRRVVVIEAGWLERLLATPLFLYAFTRSPVWRLADASAGYYVANQPVVPVDLLRIDDAAAALAALDAELRIEPNLWRLIDKISASTLEFSILRKRNAAPRPA